MTTKRITQTKRNTNGSTTTLGRTVNKHPSVADLPVDTLDDVMRRSNPPHRFPHRGGTQPD